MNKGPKITFSEQEQKIFKPLFIRLRSQDPSTKISVEQVKAFLKTEQNFARFKLYNDAMEQALLARAAKQDPNVADLVAQRNERLENIARLRHNINVDKHKLAQLEEKQKEIRGNTVKNTLGNVK